MAATLTDVARRAGVSPATVSRVLNKKMVMPIPAATVARIQEAARELRYRPNAQARALITRRTQTVGLFTSEMEDPHFAQMLPAVEGKARELGYHIAVCGDLDSLRNQGRVDGVLLLADPRSQETRDMLEGAPATFVWHEDELTPDCVAWSDNEGAYRCVRYLIELGHREMIGLIGDRTFEAIKYPKVLGYTRALNEAGLPFRGIYGQESTDQFENGYLLTRRALLEGRPFTAIYARNDFLAVGALTALREAGRNVPEEVSVVGYNDTVLAHCSALTSLRTPIAEAGIAAVEHLIKTIESGAATHPGALLETTLTLRKSCGRA